MAGQRQKPPDQLVFKRGGRGKPLQTVQVTEHSPDFPVPPGLLPEAEMVWVETMALARAHLLPTDYFQARRWIHWVNRWLQEISTLADEDLVTRGAVSDVMNPRLRAVLLIEREIKHAETVMGLNPQARMRLGITHVEEQTALEKLKARRQDDQPVRMTRKAQ